VRNNFHLLRLLMALMVVAYHGAVLPSPDGPGAFENVLAVFAETGVQGFFVLSGYLVFASLERSSSLAVYLEKRVRRLVPAYAAVVLLCALAALAVSPAARADLAGVLAYTGWNLVFLNFMAPDLPGVFADNRFTAVNGALWTIKIEVMFYLALPVLAAVMNALGRMRWAFLILVYVAAEAWRAGLSAWAAAGGPAVAVELSRQLPGQMSFFVTGMALYLWRGHLDWRLLSVAALGACALSYAFPEAAFLRAFGLGASLVWVALRWPVLPFPAGMGDLSYGVYILHFPILQAMTAAGAFERAPFAAPMMFSAILAAGAALLWRLIEKPALRADSAYRISS